MTKIHIISDLHLESNKRYDHVQPECDLVLFAGDLHPAGEWPTGIKWLKETFTKPVVYIAGNHEYYCFPFTMSEVDDSIKIYIDREKPNKIHFLQNDVFYFNDLRIIGSTMWTNFDLNNNQEESMAYAKNNMNDYFNCAYDKRAVFMTPEDTKKEHDMSIEFLIEELSKSFAGKTIVMTHHCPHPNSIHPKYTNDNLNPAFTSDLSNIIEKMEPHYWIHGHTHSSFDYIVFNTRVICNPIGHGANQDRKENPEFKKDLVIDV